MQGLPSAPQTLQARALFPLFSSFPGCTALHWFLPIMITVHMYSPQGVFLATQSRMFSSPTPCHPSLSMTVVWGFFPSMELQMIQTILFMYWHIVYGQSPH